MVIGRKRDFKLFGKFILLVYLLRYICCKYEIRLMSKENIN